MLPAEARLPDLREVIDQQAYFVLHAPRQVGKTTALLALARSLTDEGRYASALVSMESGAAFAHDIGEAEAAVLASWRLSAETTLPKELHPPPWPDAPPGARVRSALTAWARACPRPLVVFLDEVDALHDAPLLAVLRQLRDGHTHRPGSFPWSLALVGLRDVRDYKSASGGSERLHTASPFNVKVASFTMRGFTLDDVGALYRQHTDDTGQTFTDEAVERAFELTQGQPWLVNALAYVCVGTLARDRAVPITDALIDSARDVLVERQDTHLDSLAERLREPRVRAVIAPMLTGDPLPPMPVDDLRFSVDLGLVREAAPGVFEVANPIYREIIARDLAAPMRAAFPALTPTWLTAEGRLDWDRLRDAFIEFWVRHGEALLPGAPYPEAAPHLVLMAFLHRVVNGGGRVEREYAAGSGRMDLCVEYKGDRLGIEVKTWRDRDKRADPARDALAQIDGYLARTGCDRGWVVVFDQREGREALPERVRVERATTAGGRAVEVVRA